jgi:hypothetical protein
MYVDILFFPSSGSWWDRFIRIVSPSYTHVAVRVSDTLYIEAMYGRGVAVSPYHPFPGLVTYRATVTPEQRSRIIHFLYAARGDRYSVAQAIAAGILKTFGLRGLAEKVDNNWFCSELVVCAFRSAEIDLLPGYSAASVVPDDLMGSALLQRARI